MDDLTLGLALGMVSPTTDIDLAALQELTLAVARSLTCPTCRGRGYTIIPHPDPYFNEHPICQCRKTVRDLLAQREG